MSHEPNNHDRAQWAKVALGCFPAKERGEDLQNVGDLIGDLLHLAREYGLQEEADTFLSKIAQRFKEEEEDTI